MPGKMRPDGTFEDDPPAPPPAPPGPAAPDAPAPGGDGGEDDEKKQKEQERKQKEQDKKASDSNEAIIGAAAVGQSGFEKSMSDMAAGAMQTGEMLGQKFAKVTGLKAVTDTIESVVTTPLKAATKAAGYVLGAPKAIMSKMADTAQWALGMGAYKKVPEPKPAPKRKDDELAEGNENRPKNRGM